MQLIIYKRIVAYLVVLDGDRRRSLHAYLHKQASIRHPGWYVEKRAQGTYLYVRDDILVRFVRRWAHAVVEGGKDKFLIAKHIADGSVVSIILQSSKR